MGEIILQSDENDINVALNESLQSAVVGSINVNGTRLDRILVVGTSDLDHNNDSSSIPVEEIEIQMPLEFDKYVSIDTTPISKVCRACLSEKANMHSLYDTWEVETIAEMLTSFAAVQLSFGDGLPEIMCGECVELVGKCFSFKQQCERSESMLRCLLPQGHLQGMKEEPQTSNLEDEKSQKRKICKMGEMEYLGIEAAKKEPLDYEYVHDEYRETSSSIPSTNHVDKDQTGYNIIVSSKINGNMLRNRNLSIIKIPSIVINPDSKYRHHYRKKTSKQKKFMHKHAGKIIKRSVRRSVRRPKKYKDEDGSQEMDDGAGNNSDNCDPVSPGDNKTTSLDFQCYSCGKGFSNRRKLARHERIHLDVKPYNCDICRKGFIESADLQRHLRKHSSSHRPEVDGSEDRIPCSHCHLTFSCAGDLRIHSSVHLAGPGRCVCRHCSKEFFTTVQLKRHVRTHLEDKPHKCRICQKGFPEMGSLTRHFRRHTGETRERKYICSQCGKAFFDRHSLNIHERKHTGERPWVCSDCGKGFIDSRLLNSHMKIHSDEKPHACTMCEKRFKHESTLTTHIRIHTGEKPYVCTVCGNAFVQSSNLSLHMRTHTREKPYHCDQCTKKFASSSALTAHKRIHTGEKPYTCKICERRFARHDMTAHMRTHTGEKPFVCSVCSKAFTTPGQLQQHTRIHTGERPFSCLICRKGCATSSYLKKHLAKSHNVTDINSIPNLPEPESPELKKLLRKSKKSKTAEPLITDEIKVESGEIALQDSQVVNVESSMTLSSNMLNFVAVASTNGELSIIRQQTANDMKMMTLTADSSGNIETIITNTHVSQEKLFKIDPSLLRFTSGHIIPGQVAISEITSD